MTIEDSSRTLPYRPSSWTSLRVVVHLPSCSVRPDESMILLCPIRSLPRRGSRVRHRPTIEAHQLWFFYIQLKEGSEKRRHRKS